MEKLTLLEIANYCGGKVADEYRNITVTGLCRDNRKAKAGDIFVAIPGECFDGHDFAEKAIQAGASAALVSKKVDASVPTITVEDTVKALGDIARGYREKLNVKVIGVTGSVGKTTTKEMCASVFSAKSSTLKTQGNLNNHIGLPFTVMGIEKEHEFAVIEMGANHFGEISYLTQIAKPDVAIITSIGHSHIEFFGSREGIRKAKLEITEGIKEGGTLILNGDDDLLWALRGELNVNTVYCGVKNRECDLVGTLISQDPENVKFTTSLTDSVSFHIHCGGMHNMQNALLAVAAGKILGAENEEIRKGLESFKNTGERQNIFEVNGVTVISDCYNASPDSMTAAIMLLSQYKTANRTIAVLGDMLELGEYSQTAHYRIGKLCSENTDMLLCAGKWAEDMRRGATDNKKDYKAYAFDNLDDLTAQLKKELSPGDAVLVKGSRGMRMEQVISQL